MKRQILVKGLLSLTAVSLITACVDDKYDLSDIDTTSRFTVDNLTVPVNLSQIELENIVKLDDNENITVTPDGKYAISKSGDIAHTEFSIAGVHVDAPVINSTDLSVNIPGVSDIALPELNLPPVALPEGDQAPYEFKMENVDKALKVLKDIKTKQPLSFEVVLSVPSQLAASGNSISFSGLKLQLPWGLITDADGYDKATGVLNVGNLPVASDGKARLSISASGIDLGDKGTVVDGRLGISGNVGILGGDLNISVKNTVVPANLSIRADYNVSSFDLASFSGVISYEMDRISIDPISLSDLPDFLDSPETNLIIANPQILVDLHNPVGQYGLVGKGVISLTSVFKNGVAVEHQSDTFTLAGSDSKIAFCTPKEGYDDVKFDGLRNVLSNGDSGLPSSIEVNIHDILFAGEVTDFPLGDLGSAVGDYEFNAPLGFGSGSMVIYETTEDGWSSDDLDKVNIKTIHLKADCSTNLPVSISLTVVPVDKNGNEIPVDENAGRFEVNAGAKDQPVVLVIKAKNGATISGFDGVKFRAVIKQDANNTEAIGPDLHIQLNNLGVTVDGYYETDF